MNTLLLLLLFIIIGHSLSRADSSRKSKDRKNLTFLIPSGYYEHMKGQTDELTDGHVYSKLSDASTQLSSLPSESVSGVSNHYDHLHLASSGTFQIDQVSLKGTIMLGQYYMKIVFTLRKIYYILKDRNANEN